MTDQLLLFEGRELQAITVKTPAGELPIRRFNQLSGREDDDYEVPSLGWVKIAYWHRISMPNHPTKIDKGDGNLSAPLARTYELVPTMNALEVLEVRTEQQWNDQLNKATG